MERRRHRTMERGPSRKKEKKKGKLISWQRKRELERETEKKIIEIPNPPDLIIHPQFVEQWVEGTDSELVGEVSVDEGKDVESMVVVYSEDRGESKVTHEKTLHSGEEKGPMKESTKWGASFDKLLKDLGLAEDELPKGLRAEWYDIFVSVLNKCGHVEEEVDDYILGIYWGLRKEYLVKQVIRPRSLADDSGAKLEETAQVEDEADEMVEEDGEIEYVEEDYGHLCTIFADFLCGVASVPGYGPEWDRTISKKALSAFEKCYTDGVFTSCELTDDDVGIDLRGLYVDDAVRRFMKHLYCWSNQQPEIKRLFVTVGCMKHGCGEGILKNAIAEVLGRDETIPVEYFDYEDSTICITLGQTDFSHIGWTLVERPECWMTT